MLPGSGLAYQNRINQCSLLPVAQSSQVISFSPGSSIWCVECFHRSSLRLELCSSTSCQESVMILIIHRFDFIFFPLSCIKARSITLTRQLVKQRRQKVPCLWEMMLKTSVTQIFHTLKHISCNCNWNLGTFSVQIRVSAAVTSFRCKGKVVDLGATVLNYFEISQVILSGSLVWFGLGVFLVCGFFSSV